LKIGDSFPTVRSNSLRGGCLRQITSEERERDSMGRTYRYVRALAIAVLGFAGPAATAADADANHGADLAQRWCATCHLVDGSQKQASADVPTFVMIARKPNFTPEKVAFFLLDPHPKMPNFPLSRSEAADIAAYIGSLRTKRPARSD
jgi:mono/diheme cytochrome c family protein